MYYYKCSNILNKCSNLNFGNILPRKLGRNLWGVRWENYLFRFLKA